MKFAKFVFVIAGVWGVLVLTPLYFIFDRIGVQDPPPITHPGFYYGFAAVGLAWQVAFLVIGFSPARLRPMMIPAALEKFGYVATVLVLFQQQRMKAPDLAFAVTDGVLGLLFLAAWFKTSREAQGY
ncbi:MAG: hypothetical protein H0X25_07910 [Acidobacteriales bacterium]|nr:hypothetical protein [Terriglobales bacterium]